MRRRFGVRSVRRDGDAAHRLGQGGCRSGRGSWVARDEAVRVHGCPQAGAVLRVAKVHGEWADDEVRLSRLALGKLLGDGLVVLVEGLGGEREDEHGICGLVRVREHNAVLVR